MPARCRTLAAIAALTFSACTGARGGQPPAGPPAQPAAEVRSEYLHRQRTQVTRFGFEEKIVVAPLKAPMPAEWERYVEYLPAPDSPSAATLPGEADRPDVETARPADTERRLYYGPFPDYLRVEVQDLDRRGTPLPAVHSGRRSIRMQLAGTRDMDMVAVRRKHPLEVNADFAYELSGWVRLQGVVKDETYAQLWIEWLDGNGRPTGRISKSDRVNRAYLAGLARRRRLKSAPDWVPTPEFRVNDVDPRARFARVWCVASGRETRGYAYFDDLAITRRPKVSAEPDPRSAHWIFSHGQVPALRLTFQGLQLGDDAGKLIGYRRVIRWVDLYGRTGTERSRRYEPFEIQGNTIEEPVRLDGLRLPGCYAVEIALEALSAGGSRKEIAKRVVRLAKLPELSVRSGKIAEELFAVDANLYGPETKAARLTSAARRCGVRVLSCPLWREEADPARFGLASEKVSPEELLERQLRDLAAARIWVVGVLAPVPRKVRRQLNIRNAGHAARGFYKVREARWKPFVETTARYFQTYVSEWRMAAADDDSFREATLDRSALAGQLRRALLRAPSKQVVVPLHVDSLPRPAPALTPADHRELVYVPAETSAAALRATLDEVFPETEKAPPGSPVGAPRAAPGGEAARSRPAAGPEPVGLRSSAGRQWFLQLPEAGENLSLKMEEERDQVIDLARKVTLLAMHGADRIHVELADSRRGLLGAGLYPRPAYVAYCVLAEQLTGASYVGEFDLTGAARAFAFERGGRGLLVYWSDGTPREIACQLGAVGQATLIEMSGARRTLRRPRNTAEARNLADAEMVPLSPVPAVLMGLEPAFVRTRLGFGLTSDARLQTRYQPQEVSFEVHNHFEESMEAEVIPHFPRGSRITPRFRRVSVDAGESVRVPFSVRPSFVETVGDKDITVDLKLSAGNRSTASFTLPRKITVESPITLLPTVTPSKDRAVAEVQVHVKLSADEKFAYLAGERDHGLRPDEGYDLEVYLVVPGGYRRRAHVRGIRPGKEKKTDYPFVVPLGAMERTVYVGARLRGGAWFTNVEIRLPAAVTTRQ
ncbi:MAG: hypothetical protein ACYTGB_03555 [Planctomycetota bacterium]